MYSSTSNSLYIYVCDVGAELCNFFISSFAILSTLLQLFSPLIDRNCKRKEECCQRGDKIVIEEIKKFQSLTSRFYAFMNFHKLCDIFTFVFNHRGLQNHWSFFKLFLNTNFHLFIKFTLWSFLRLALF